MTNENTTKPSKQETRRAEAAIKRQKMLEEQQREKDKVKDRLHLIRQMKGTRGPSFRHRSCLQSDRGSFPTSIQRICELRITRRRGHDNFVVFLETEG